MIRISILILFNFFSFIFYSFCQDELKIKDYINEYNNIYSHYSIDSSISNVEINQRLIILCEGDLKQDTAFVIINPTIRNDNKIVFRYKKYHINLEIKKFDRAKHKIEIVKDSILKVDNKIKLGCLFSIPDMEFSRFDVSYNKKRINFKESNNFKAYNMSFKCYTSIDNITDCMTELYYDKITDKIYLQIIGGDEGLSYYKLIYVFNYKSCEGITIYAP